MRPDQENNLTLAQILGITEEDASQRLLQRVALSGAAVCPQFAAELGVQIGRTLTLTNEEASDVEVVLAGEPRTGAPIRVFVRLSPQAVEVSDEGPASIEQVHPFLQAVGACYVASAVIDQATALGRGTEPLIVKFEDLGVSDGLLGRKLKIANATLAGAGAIGNGLLRALRHINVSGSLTIADPKLVSQGNQNRCPYFNEESVGKPKAEELCARAQADFPEMELVPFVGDFSSLVSRDGKAHTVLVATDSRRVRRTIQSELPLEVIDASTTGTDEIVVHNHHQPTTGACLACIYKHVPDELVRERDIAAGLGIDLEDIHQNLIDEPIARKIAKTHPQIRPDDIVGKAFDSLFRELCAVQALKTPEAAQVFAPFSFISGLAGSLLAIEILRAYNVIDDEGANYFVVNPWRGPNRMMRLRRQKDVACEICSRPQFSEAMRELWGGQAA